MDAPPIQYARTDDGVSIAYAVMGDGPPLFVVEAVGVVGVQAAMRHAPSRAFYEALAQKHQLIIFDGRGRGGSDRGISDFSLAAGVRDGEAVRRSEGIEEADLFATFRWAPPAIEWAAQPASPIRRLVLWHPYVDFEIDIEERPTTAAVVFASKGDWRAFTELGMASAGVPPADVSGFATMTMDAVEPSDYLRMIEAMKPWDVGQRLAEVSAPTLVLHRADNRIVSIDAAQRVAAGIPHAQLVVMEGPELLPIHGDQAAAIVAIDRFLASSKPAAPQTAAPMPVRERTSGPKLTGREIEVLRLIADGSSNPEIAEALVISPGTVARHVTNILNKTGCRNRADAARYAAEHGLTGP